MQLVYDRSEDVARFILAQIPHDAVIAAPYYAIGVESKGEIVGGVILHNPQRLCDGRLEMEMTAGALPGRMWISNSIIVQVFTYAFVTLDCSRLTAGIHPENEKSIRFTKRLNFKLEGRLRDRFAPGQDVLVFGLLRREVEVIQPLLKPV